MGRFLPDLKHKIMTEEKALKAVEKAIDLAYDKGKKLPIQLVSGSLQDIQEIIEFLQWAFRKIDKGDTPKETVRMLLMDRAKIDNIKFDSNNS